MENGKVCWWNQKIIQTRKRLRNSCLKIGYHGKSSIRIWWILGLGCDSNKYLKTGKSDTDRMD